MISIDVMNRILIRLHYYLTGAKGRCVKESFRTIERTLLKIGLPNKGIDLVAAFYASWIYISEHYFGLSLEIEDKKNLIQESVCDILGFKTFDIDNAASYIFIEGMKEITKYMKMYDAIFEYENVFKYLHVVIAHQDINVIFNNSDEKNDFFKNKSSSMFCKAIKLIGSLMTLGNF
jgi:hypothetical protein